MKGDGRLSKRRSLWSAVEVRRATGALLVSIAIAGCAATAPSASPVASPTAVSAALTADPSASASPAERCPEDLVASGTSGSVDSTSSSEWFAWSKGYVAFCQSELPDPSANPSATFNENATYFAITPWRSDDGRSWQPGRPMDVAGLGDTTWIARMVEGPAGIVAVARGAYVLDDPATGGFADAVTGVWTSKDGLSWTRVDLVSALGVDALGDVAVGPSGYIASNLSSASASLAPKVWLSADGRKWRSVALGKSALSGAHLGSAYVLPNGYLLAGWKGVPIGQELDTTPAIWFSPDGASWRETNLPGVVAAPMKEAVVEMNDPGRYIAVVGTWSCGCEPPDDDQAWISSDGTSWQPYSGGS